MRVPAALLAILCGCGGSAFSDGLYAGNVSETLACSDGSGGTQSGWINWTLSQSGAELTIRPYVGACSPMWALVTGDKAAMRAETCATQSVPNGQATPAITGGTVTSNGNSLALDVKEAATVNYAGAAPVTCTGSFSGTLKRY